MKPFSFRSRVLLCAMPLAVAALQSIPATADNGQWELGYSFLCHVSDIAVDSQHNVYVLNLGDHPTIRVFTQDAQFLREGQGFDQNARSFAIDENDEIYVLYYLHDRSNRIGWVTRYDPDFQPLGGWVYAHSDLEMGFAIDVRDGIAYIGTGSSLLKFTTDGVLLNSFDWGWGWWSVEIAPDGSVWVAEPSGLVRHYSSDGAVLAQWNAILPGEEYSGASDIALDSTQRVFVADPNNALKIFSADGIIDDTILVWAYSVALDGDDVLYVGNLMQLMKYVYTPLSAQPATWGRIKAAFDQSGRQHSLSMPW